MNKITDEVFKKILELREQGLFLKEICEIIGVHKASLYRFLKRNNLKLAPVKRRKSYRKYAINENYFENIDTSDKAYILGFLYADGYNDEKKGTVTIAINNRDISVLNYIKQQLETDYPIWNLDKNMIRLCIGSKKISQSLSKWGCHQAKTFTLTFPTFLSEDLIPHFIRGYFDGDGCIHLPNNRNNATINFAGSLSFLEGVSSFLNKEHDIKTSSFRKHGNIYYIYIHRSLDIYKIYNIFYKENTFFFERKKEKFEKFFQKISPVKLIDTKDIISLYNEGKTIKEVAKHYNMSVMGVYQRLVKEDSSYIRTTKIEENRKNEIIEMIKLGFLPKDIKGKTGISNSQLYRYIKKYKNADNK